ncbi:MAG: uncharacterized protein QG652_1682 [Pseudomonadota bacterium]|nr:uncharacterized protein [Pseudomonadota bacterium]
MRFIIFFSIFLLVMAALNYYSYRRFFRKLSLPFSRYALVIPVLLMLGNLVFVTEAAMGFMTNQPMVVLVTSTAVGFTFVFFVIATFYDLTMTASKHVPFDQERRKFIKVIFDVTILIAAMSYLMRGLTQGLKYPDINRVQVKIKNFSAREFNLVQISDVHVGRTIRREFMEDMVQRVNALAPDMVVITGDLVDLRIEHIKQDLQPLENLKAPVYFITGNHEYFHGVEETIEYLRTLNIKPLLNENVICRNGECHFNLIGINDLIGERMNVLPPDLAQAYAGMNPELPSIVLAHQPKTIERIADYPCDLMLSGHTHGGQIFPFGILVMMDQPYLAGLYQHDADRQIFVSRGTGYWGPPLRILAPSEITHLVITA